VRDDDDARRLGLQGSAEGPVDDHGDLLGTVHLPGELCRDIPEQSQKVDLLHIGGAEHGAALLPDDGDHGDTVEFRVVQPVQEVHGTRPLRGCDDADAAGEFRVADRHQRGVLLMPGLHELRRIGRSVERLHERVDPVAAVTENAANVPLLQPPHNGIRHQFFTHLRHLRVRVGRMLSHATPACGGDGMGA